MITLLLILIFKLILSIIYILFWLLTLPIRILLYPFKSNDGERMGLFSTLGWCLLFHDLID